MAFTFDVNSTPIDGTEAMMRLVAVMIGAGASCQSYGLGTGSNQPGGDLVFNDPAVSAPLMRVTSAYVEVVFNDATGGTKTLLFQRGASNAIWGIKYCPVLLNDASADGTTPGTHADLRDVWASDTFFSADDVSGAFRCSVAAGTKGASAFGAYLEAWDIGSGTSRTLFLVDPVSGSTGDPDAYVFYAQYGSTAGNIGQMGSFRTGIGQYGHTWYRYGLSSAAWCLAATPWRDLQQGDSGEGRAFPMACTTTGYANTDDLFPIMWIVNTGGNTFIVKGLSQMFCQNSVSRATGWTFNPSGSGDDYVTIQSGVCAPWPEGVGAVI